MSLRRALVPTLHIDVEFVLNGHILETQVLFLVCFSTKRVHTVWHEILAENLIWQTGGCTRGLPNKIPLMRTLARAYHARAETLPN